MPWKVVRIAKGESGAAWAGEVAAGGWRGGEPLKVEGGVAVRAAIVCGAEVVVKSWRLRGATRLKARLGLSRGARQWRGAHRVSRLGIRTARPIALIRGPDDEVLVMERLAGPTLLDTMARGGGDVRDDHQLAATIGGQVAAFGRWFNRDHKPSNLIVLRDRGILSLAVIDTVAIRRAPRDSAARMLASLVLEPTGCGRPPRLPLRMRALRAYLAARGMTGRAARNALWRRVAAILQAHGDPTPRVDPLAGRERGIDSPCPQAP
ncbi:MAG: hypothetical protein IT437_04015 [Phycisphaerales bacterium]|nr:hypothetical protein [Phycisphaerales bacterium]